jgi:hypothetical protein
MLGFSRHICPPLTTSHSDEPFLTPRRTEAKVLASKHVAFERTDCVATPHPAHRRELWGATYVLMVEVALAGILTVAAGVSRE